MRALSCSLAAVAALAWPVEASAFDWFTVAQVAALEATYAPSQVRFWITTTVGNCPGGQGFGSQLDYRPSGSTPDERIANGQAVMAVIMTAKATGRSIKIFGRNTDCVVEFIYLV